MKTRNILIVEDDEPLLDLLGGFAKVLNSLKSSDNIFLAEDGQEAEDICKKIHIDVLISDLKMPHKNGEELLDYLQASKNFDGPVFLLSGYFDKKMEKKFGSMNNVTIFKKPFGVESLFGKIDRYLGSK